MFIQHFLEKLHSRPSRIAGKKWFKDKGDETLRLNYELNMNSIVFDLGGFEGQWTNDIYERYHCQIFVFEPVKSFYNNILMRFKGIDKIKPYNIGLSNDNKTCEISLDQDGSSLYKKRDKTQTIELVNAIDFLEINKISKIDLMKINIEGGEYDLLEYLISNDYIRNILDIQIQFHDCPEINGKGRMKRIQSELSKTHALTYQYYPYVWENWRRKDK